MAPVHRSLLSILLLALFPAMAISQARPPSVPRAANPPKGSATNTSAPTTTPSPKPAPSIARSPVPAPSPIGSPQLAPRPSPSPLTSNGTLDPSQAAALQALKVPVPSNPCAGSHATMICDDGAGAPFKRLIFLQLQYCPAGAVLSDPALKNLTGLQAISFFDCPMKISSSSVPPELAISITSLSIVSSLGRTSGFEDMPGLSAAWLSKFRKVADLTVMDVTVNASSLSAIVSNMTELREIKISNASVRGELPRSWTPAARNLTSIDLSLNSIRGPIPAAFFADLDQLQSLDLTGNNLSGQLPGTMGRMRSLQRLSVSSNDLTGSIPAAAFENLTALTYLDLSNNGLNGSVPAALTKLRDLRYLDIRNNKLKGVLPFNTSFLSRLNSFKASGNPSLCYNSSSVAMAASRLVSGIAPCDESGKPITSDGSGGDGPAAAPEGMAPLAEADGQNSQSRRSKHHGPKTIVWAVATALGAIFLFIALIVVFSKWCRWKEA